MKKTEISITESANLSKLIHSLVYYCDITSGPTGTWKDLISQSAVRQAIQKHSKGIVVATSGNHGKAIAYEASKLNLPVKILTYEDTSDGVISELTKYGAEITKHKNRDELYKHLEKFITQGWFSATLLNNQRGNTQSPGVEGYEEISIRIHEHQTKGKPPPFIIIPTSYGDGALSIYNSYLKISGTPPNLVLLRANEKSGSSAPSISTDFISPEVNTLINNGCRSLHFTNSKMINGAEKITKELNKKYDLATGGIPAAILTLKEIINKQNASAYCLLTGRSNT